MAFSEIIKPRFYINRLEKFYRDYREEPYNNSISNYETHLSSQPTFDATDDEASSHTISLALSSLFDTHATHPDLTHLMFYRYFEDSDILSLNEYSPEDLELFESLSGYEQDRILEKLAFINRKHNYDKMFTFDDIFNPKIFHPKSGSYDYEGLIEGGSVNYGIFNFHIPWNIPSANVLNERRDENGNYNKFALDDLNSIFSSEYNTTKEESKSWAGFFNHSGFYDGTYGDVIITPWIAYKDVQNQDASLDSMQFLNTIGHDGVNPPHTNLSPINIYQASISEVGGNADFINDISGKYMYFPNMGYSIFPYSCEIPQGAAVFQLGISLLPASLSSSDYGYNDETSNPPYSSNACSIGTFGLGHYYDLEAPDLKMTMDIDFGDKYKVKYNDGRVEKKTRSFKHSNWFNNIIKADTMAFINYSREESISNSYNLDSEGNIVARNSYTSPIIINKKIKS